MKKKDPLFYFILISFLVLSCNSNNNSPDIDQNELYEHIDFLADSSLKGRFPGSQEDKKAAKYIAKDFNLAGLSLLFNGGLQKFEILKEVSIGENNSLFVDGKELILNKDYTPVSFSDNSKAETEAVFVGFGFNVKNKSQIWNDYASVNVKDKWVIVLRGEPLNPEYNLPFSDFSSLRTKALTAKDNGAKGVIFVSGENFDKKDELIEVSRPEGNVGIPVIHIKREMVNQLLKETNKSINKLESEINKGDCSFYLNKLISCKTEIVKKKVNTYNVVSKLELKPQNKYIVIGAHYDHLGTGGEGTGTRSPNSNEVHYGADDNASGVASMLEIAEKLVYNKDSLKYNFIFIAFGAEEMGLKGSKYFVNHMPIEDSLVLCMINIDMLGRMKAERSLQVGGIGTTVKGESLLEEVNKSYDFKLSFSPEGYGPSDHSSFYAKDIPVFFFSTGAHIDYHTPGDSIGNINFNGLEEASNFIYDFISLLSKREILFAFQEAGPKIPTGHHRNRDLKATLGIMPDFSGVEKRGLRADVVIKGKPAYKAGMKKGDIIVAINGFSVGDIYEYMERLSKFRTGEIITVEVLRKDKKEVLIVQL